jgi:tetratricopeptide (TPR) repeat protein
MVLDAQLADTGDPDKALADVRSLLKGKPEDREVYVTAGHHVHPPQALERCRGRSQQSRAAFHQSRGQRVRLFLRGSTYEREKKFDEAEAEFKKVLAEPAERRTLNYLGYMNADRGVRSKSRSTTSSRR